MIEKIWLEYVNSEEYNKPENDYSISEEDKKGLIAETGEEAFLKIEDVAMSLAVDAECIGFVNGFKLAVRLIMECK